VLFLVGKEFLSTIVTFKELSMTENLEEKDATNSLRFFGGVKPWNSAMSGVAENGFGSSFLQESDPITVQLES